MSNHIPINRQHGINGSPNESIHGTPFHSARDFRRYAQKIMNTWYCIANTKQWVKAVILQGKRLLETHHTNMSMQPQNVDELVKFHEAMEIERIEQYFFIITVNKARDWLNESSKVLPDAHPVAKKYNETLPNVKDLRDMREHEIQYFKNKGKKQDEFVRRRGSTAADATGTFIDEDNYNIGNRLSVQQAIQVSEEVYPAIVNIFQKLNAAESEEE